MKWERKAKKTGVNASNIGECSVLFLADILVAGDPVVLLAVA